MANIQISAIDIKSLWYTDPKYITEDLTGAMLYDLINGKDGVGETPKIKAATEVYNIHQDTWQIEESDNSQDSYRNQLTGAVYRMGKKTMGELTFNWTIGKYDYQMKKDLLGGEVIVNSKGEAVGWKRARGTVDVRHCLIALTLDGQYCVLPQANVNTREANTDGAIGLSVVGTMMEPDVQAVSGEYWFDEGEVKKGE